MNERRGIIKIYSYITLVATRKKKKKKTRGRRVRFGRWRFGRWSSGE
jgi:hypothetical protein